MESAGAGKRDFLRKEAMCSEQWDCSDGPTTPRFRYVVFSLQRTRSELLCDYLIQRATGVPFEYFHHLFMRKIADRLGCPARHGHVEMQRYLSLLESKRTRNGIFGTMLQPEHLKELFGDDNTAAVRLLRRFDRIILLRRRDRVLQAISLARAHLTNQGQRYGGDEVKPVPCGDEVLFQMIGARLGKLRSEEQYMATLTSELDPGSVRALWYEDLSDPRALAAVAEWLWSAAGNGSPMPAPDHAHDLPTRMDETEARAVKGRFLSAVGIS